MQNVLTVHRQLEHSPFNRFYQFPWSLDERAIPIREYLSLIQGLSSLLSRENATSYLLRVSPLFCAYAD